MKLKVLSLKVAAWQAPVALRTSDRSTSCPYRLRLALMEGSQLNVMVQLFNGDLRHRARRTGTAPPPSMLRDCTASLWALAHDSELQPNLYLHTHSCYLDGAHPEELVFMGTAQLRNMWQRGGGEDLMMSERTKGRASDWAA